MTDAVVVRVAAASDLAFVESTEVNHGVSAGVLKQKVENGDIFVAENEGMRVGYLRLDHLYSVVPYISLVVVDPAQCGVGIGRALLIFVEAKLRDEGHKFLLSSCELDEPEPQEWHRKMGFQDCGVLFGVSPGRYGDLFLRKSLS